MANKKSKPLSNTSLSRESQMIPLAKALRLLKAAKPWVPVAALRSKITRGEIPARRSGNGPRARYYVLMSDLEAALPTQQVAA